MQYETNMDFGVTIHASVESEKEGSFEQVCAKAHIYPAQCPLEEAERFNSRVQQEIQYALDVGPDGFSSKRDTFDRARISVTEELKNKLDHVCNINVTLLLMQDAQKWLDANTASNERIEKERNSYNRYVKTEQFDDGEYTEQIENAAYKLWFRFYPKSYHKKPVMVAWPFLVNSPISRSMKEIAGGGDHLFDTVEEAQKYMDGRKKAYEKYFTEIQPPILPGYERWFGMFGKLLDGYRIGEI